MTIAAYILIAITLGPLVVLGFALMNRRHPRPNIIEYRICFGRRVTIHHCERRSGSAWRDN